MAELALDGAASGISAAVQETARPRSRSRADGYAGQAEGTRRAEWHRRQGQEAAPPPRQEAGRRCRQSDKRRAADERPPPADGMQSAAPVRRGRDSQKARRGEEGRPQAVGRPEGGARERQGAAAEEERRQGRPVGGRPACGEDRQEPELRARRSSRAGGCAR